MAHLFQLALIKLPRYSMRRNMTPTIPMEWPMQHTDRMADTALGRTQASGAARSPYGPSAGTMTNFSQLYSRRSCESDDTMGPFIQCSYLRHGV